MQKFIVGKNDADQRLDKYLTKKFPDMPSGILYKGVRKKRIKINGKRAEISTKLKEGDILELYINDEFLTPKAEKADIYHLDPELNIIYEDENLLLVDKAPGVSVHADETDKTTTLITHIQAYLYLKGEYDPKNEATFTPSLCNRIDKNTGGIVIAAKNAKTLRVINQ
ncbi:MAG: RluA family pseudouridine synthase, partial [Clostridia bacterium]|nr:RluA family pseudouridine synthase [Clostridia bacterium]